MEVDPSVWDDSGEFLEDKAKYRRLVGKLIYLTVTRLDISFDVGLVSHFLDKPKQVHWDAVIRILQYIKKSPGKRLLFKKNGHLKIEGYSDADNAGSKSDRKSTYVYCTYLGGNLVTWRSKKQHIVARSSAEAEYRVMAHTATEMIEVKNLLGELRFTFNEPLPMHCDNQAAVYIANNPIFHERTKHIEIVDTFTKPLSMKRFSKLCTKMDMINIYDPV
ncbi:secreted RxLR effector protein 161-like [Salvia splendens]|uniref:secreted RxLR effector protein 161-like n=1 Tax=Salvia splendens TaxID=180675 RepID=UPI001C2556C3|nr:secreted RxLR effector protein 161-like [Salvia splendens]